MPLQATGALPVTGVLRQIQVATSVVPRNTLTELPTAWVWLAYAGEAAKSAMGSENRERCPKSFHCAGLPVARLSPLNLLLFLDALGRNGRTRQLDCRCARGACTPASSRAGAALPRAPPGSAESPLSGRLLLRVLDPADELVAGQRRDVVPGLERRALATSASRRSAGSVHDPTGHSVAAHGAMVVSRERRRKPLNRAAFPGQWRRWELNPRPQSRQVASTSVSGALISSSARHAGGVAGTSLLKMSPVWRR